MPVIGSEPEDESILVKKVKRAITGNQKEVEILDKIQDTQLNLKFR